MKIEKDSVWRNIFTKDKALVVKSDSTYVTYLKNGKKFTKPITVFIKTHKQAWHT